MLILIVPLLLMTHAGSGHGQGFEALKSPEWFESNPSATAEAKLLAQQIKELDLNQRSYLITGAGNYLASFNQLKDTIQARFASIQRQVQNNRQQANRITLVQNLLKRWFEHAADPAIAQRKLANQTKTDGSQLQRTLTEGVGASLLDEIRINLDEIDDNYKNARQTKGQLLVMQVAQDVSALESAQRSFLVTGKNDFLVPFYDGQTQLELDIKALKSFARKGPLAQDNLELITEITELSDLWIDKGATPEIELRKEMNASETTMKDVMILIESGTGPGIMGHIKTQLAAFIDGEGSTFLSQGRRVYAIVGGSVVGLMGLAWVTFVWLRSRRKKTSLEKYITATTSQPTPTSSDAPMSRANITSLAKAMTDMQELNVTERNLLEMMDKSPELIACADGHTGELVYLNQEARKWFGLEAEEPIKGANLSELLSTWKDNIELGTWTGESLLTHENGREVPVLTTLTYLAADDDAVPCVTVQLRDLTQQKAEELARTKMLCKTAQEERLASLGQFAGTVANDFNNVLGGVVGYTALLRKTCRANTKTFQQLDKIAESAEYAALLTDSLLEFSLQSDYSVKSMDINRVIQEALGFLSETLNEDIIVHVNLDDSLWAVDAGVDQMMKIMLSLASNAAEAMPEGGELEFTSRNLNEYLDSGPYVHISIRDTGCGIPAAAIGKVFDPYFTTKQTGELSGLGLATVYGLVKRHQGFIEIHSELGAGTVVDMYFPARPDVVLTHEAVQQELDLVEPKIDRTILVVDNSKIMRDLARDSLEESDATMLFAENGEEAMRVFAAHEKKIDLLILDMAMPIMDGLKVYQELSKTEEDLKVLFSSGAVEGHEVKELRKTKPGNIEFIKKPFTRDDLIRQIGLLVTPELSHTLN